MKPLIIRLALVLCLAYPSIGLQAQTLLSLGNRGLIGMPDTTHFGDTLSGLSTVVHNIGPVPISAGTLNILAWPNSSGLPFIIGTHDLSLLPIMPGDSIVIPLDYFVVSPQNSNSGSNIMVIWPTAPGSTPSDSSQTDYYVDGTTATSETLAPIAFSIYPNPTMDKVWLQGLPLPTCQFQVLDLSGRQLLACDITELQAIDLPNLPAGVYIYRILAHGRLQHSGRLLKQVRP